MLLVILFVVAKATWNVYAKEQSSNEKRDRVVAELQMLKERERTLTASITRLSTDEGVEAEIRENYRLAKPGEQLVVIVDERQKEVVEDKGAIRSVWDSFINIFK